MKCSFLSSIDTRTPTRQATHNCFLLPEQKVVVWLSFHFHFLPKCWSHIWKKFFPLVDGSVSRPVFGPLPLLFGCLRERLWQCLLTYSNAREKDYSTCAGNAREKDLAMPERKTLALPERKTLHCQRENTPLLQDCNEQPNHSLIVTFYYIFPSISCIQHQPFALEHCSTKHNITVKNCPNMQHIE